MEKEGGKTFDPTAHLSLLNGKDYLEVKWRLAWFRDEHPDGQILTEMIRWDDTIAIFKASVSVRDGGTATGWGSETPKDFRDYIEKAETKALGRALAALGYGTQFAYEFEDPSNEERPKVVDSPVSRPAQPKTPAGNAPPPSGPATKGPLATPAQVQAIYTIGRGLAMHESEIDNISQRLYKVVPVSLSKQQASAFIDMLKTGNFPAAAETPKVPADDTPKAPALRVGWTEDDERRETEIRQKIGGLGWTAKATVDYLHDNYQVDKLAACTPANLRALEEVLNETMKQAKELPF